MSLSHASLHSRTTSMAYLRELALSHLKEIMGTILLVLTLASEGELVLGLSIGDLVDSEPLVSSPKQTG